MDKMPEKKRIVIVDDDKIALESLKRLLDLSGFETQPCIDAKDAINIIKSFKPQVILLDLIMPGFGGLEVCEMLNKDKETQAIPVIVVSSLGRESDIKKAYKMGVIGYVTKPYDIKKLIGQINKAIADKEERNA